MPPVGARLDVAGIGSLVVDRIFRVPRIIGPEEKILLGSYPDGAPARVLHGGVTLNHLAWASAMGLRCGVFGRLPEDEGGRFLRDGMRRFRMETHLDADGGSSAFALIFVDPRGHRAIYMNRGATGETTAAEIDRRHGAFLRRAAIVSTEISQLPLPAVVAALGEARRAGIPGVLDVDVPPADAVRELGSRRDLERALALATHLKPTLAAAAALVGKGPPLLLARRLRSRYGSRAVAITDGARGCAVSAEGFEGTVSAFRVRRVVDTTGCGDAFLGGFLAGLRRGLPWPETARLANACGAACAETLGAFPIPGASRRRVEALLRTSATATAR